MEALELNFLEMLEQVYGIVIEKGKYVDLEVKTDITVTSPNGIYYVPKTVTRGDKRENLALCVVRTS